MAIGYLKLVFAGLYGYKVWDEKDTRLQWLASLCNYGQDGKTMYILRK